MTPFKYIKIYVSAILLWFSVALYADIIYETDYKENPTGATTSSNKGSFTTSMPTWGEGFSSAYLTSGSAGECTITFANPINLTLYKDVQIIIQYGSASSRPLVININGTGDKTIHTMASSAERNVVITVPTDVTENTISSILVKSSGGGAVYFFHITITGTPLVDCPEDIVGDTTAYFLKGQSVTVWGETFTTEATRQKTYKTSEGCDSIVTLHVKETTSGSVINKTICEGETYTWSADGKTYSQTTDASVVKKNQQGTDSICMLHLIVNPIQRTSETHTIGEGETYTWNGKTYDTPGDYTYQTSSVVTGCDSIVTLHLLKNTPTDITATICKGDTFYWYINGALYNKYTTSKNTSTTKDGIKYYLNLTVQEPTYTEYTYRLNLLQHEQYTWNGKKYSLPGIYFDTTQVYDDSGCPKQIDYLILNGDTSSYYCKGTTYYWRDKSTTSSSTTLKYQSPTIKIDGSSRYYTISNYVVRKDATNSTTYANIDFGESYEWFGKLYQKTGVYRDTIANVYGCDSIGVLNLTVCGEATGDTIVGICHNEGKTSVTAWGETFYGPATRTRIYKTALGCDSLVTLHVVESSPTEGVENVTINKGESYYWRYTETSYTTTQDVSVTLKNYCGCDSTLTLHLIVQDIPADGKHLAKTICEGDVYTWHGKDYTVAGTYVADDCDSVLHLGMLPNPNIEVCEDQIVNYKCTTQVWVGGADYYAWDNEHALSSEWSDQPEAFPDTTTVFHIKSYNSAAANAITNGDFELGKTGSPAGTNPTFSTDANWSTEGGTYGKYIIAHNTNEMWSSDNYYDHTKGNAEGYMMIMDGFDTPDNIIWQQTVSVTPNTDYIFSAWFLSLKSSFDKNSYAKFQFFVNGEQLGPVANAPNVRGKWGRYYELWDSGSETTAVLTIKNQNTDGKGNDFALDDISFQALGPCYGYDSVKVITNFNVDLYGDGTMNIEQRNDYTDRNITYYIENYPTQIGTYYHGDQITVRVYNTECAEFVKWSDDKTNNPRIFTVGEDDFTIQPIFVGEPFTITTEQVGEGNVTGGQQYWCKDTATITATPADCWRFVKWEEDGDTNPVRTFEVTEEKTMTAIFEKIPYVITIRTKDNTTTKGSVTGNIISNP
ncbi:MAG: hypothetical protein MJZ64_06255 [Paludibacteraceae bacterium]|nr:hypothetical protein [Paludibacteraceae bacterium]